MQMKKVLIFDTSILCTWLGIPGMESCGHDDARWDQTKIEEKVQIELKEKTIFVLPIAGIVETGNHIAQAPHSRYEKGLELADLMKKSAQQETPWAAFSDQTVLWSSEKLLELAKKWPKLADSKFSLGDATIKDVAEHYSQSGFQVEILTGDEGLKAYEPRVLPEIPRRQKRR